MRVTGYSWKTNEYGLTIDSVTEFHLVLPNGTQKVVTEVDEDLWFALKVCLNDGNGGGAMRSVLTRTIGWAQQLCDFPVFIEKADNH
jgi:hypothetical protein